MDLEKKSPRYSDRLQRGTYKAMMYVFLCLLLLVHEHLYPMAHRRINLDSLLNKNMTGKPRRICSRTGQASEAGEQEYNNSESDDEKDVGKGVERDGERNGEMDGERDGERESESGGESDGKRVTRRTVRPALPMTTTPTTALARRLVHLMIPQRLASVARSR
ncbi:hypothetical protein BT96DRAFT_1007718 [Gymnopus androsaceus JB14]|uniref:Uncharacterized protein n=1 Tax=Gymnopus androsaceus JB14 TaxID=1447944 RepID=A0A6A4GHH3_9AGAR|nr:hypothetical protein BT96DRAFT_1007718 [Gymnopus androsaceus JB14]